MMWDMHSYEDVVADGSVLAQIVADSLKGRRLICNRRQVPPFWLIHGGRLLPALIWDAAKRIEKTEEALQGLCIPPAAKYGYLPRAYTGDVAPFVEACELTIGELVEGQEIIQGQNGPLINVRADPLIKQFFEDLVSHGTSIDDRWDWSLFQRCGGVPVCPFDPIAYDWREYYDRSERDFARPRASM
jgi:hypothetical protein